MNEVSIRNVSLRSSGSKGDLEREAWEIELNNKGAKEDETRKLLNSCRQRV